MRTLTLREMGTKYINEADEIKERARRLRSGADRLTGKRRRDMLRRIYSLYESSRDARATGMYLQSYRGDEN